MDTPILAYIKEIMEQGVRPLEGISNGGVIEEVWLCEMIFTLEARYKNGGIL